MPYAVALEFDRNAAAQITAIAARTAAAWGDRATTIRPRRGICPWPSMTSFPRGGRRGVGRACRGRRKHRAGDVVDRRIPGASAGFVALLAPAVTEPLLGLHDYYYGHRALLHVSPRLPAAIPARPLRSARERGHGSRDRGVDHDQGLLGQRLATLPAASRCPEALGFPLVLALKQWPRQAATDRMEPAGRVHRAGRQPRGSARPRG
jgi:hypothetical protein